MNYKWYIINIEFIAILYILRILVKVYTTHFLIFLEIQKSNYIKKGIFWTTDRFSILTHKNFTIPQPPKDW